jgi:hypothetical protein
MQMPTLLLPKEEVRQWSDRLTLPQYKVLWRVRREGQIVNSQSLGRETFEALQQLAAAGLVDPGYNDGKPWNWVINKHGERALRLFDAVFQEDEDAPPVDTATWLP